MIVATFRMSLRPASTVRASFPVTAWTQVVTAREGDEVASKAALEELCKGYWPAIYTYLRALGCDREEALDETQEFMTHFIQGGGLHNVSPERGRLRSYLRQSLRNHLTTVRRDAARQNAVVAKFSSPWMTWRSSMCPVNRMQPTSGLTVAGPGPW
jgi:hypothetical protein